MSKIIIDITELTHWKGELTGVPRVMNELASRYAEHDSVVFARWDGSVRKFVQTSLPDFSVRKEDTSKDTRVSLRKRVARKVVYSNPVSTKAVKKAKDYGVRVSNRVSTVSSGKVVSIHATDTLFILADWHGSDRAFIPQILLLKDQGVRIVQIAYDLLPLVTPQYSGHSTNTLKKYVEQVYPICDLILAISDHTKRDIIEWLKQSKLAQPEIEVFRLGDDFKLSIPAKPEHRYFKHPSDFILCVGTMEARKNHTLLYYTYKLAKERGIELPRLVIVGRKGWRTDDIYALMTEDTAVKDSFILLQSTSDEELAWLYSNCKFSVYPSFYEGWGLPIAESIAYGVPCIAANTSSMPEVAGDLIDYFSPVSSDECLHKIQHLLNPKNLDTARSRIKKYEVTSWDDTYGQVKNYLEARK